MKKLEETGYRPHPNSVNSFKNEATWVGRKVYQNGIRLLQDKLDQSRKNLPKKAKKN